MASEAEGVCAMSLGNITALLDKAFGNSMIPGMPVAREVQHRVTVRSYDVATGMATRSETVHTRPAIIMHYSTHEVAKSGGLIQQGDRLVMLRPVANVPAPEIDDRIIIESDTFVILDIIEKQIGDTPLVYRCHCREGG
jgi:hypothetical protein